MSISNTKYTNLTTTNFTTSADANINGVRVGRGNGNVFSNTCVGNGALNTNRGLYNCAFGQDALRTQNSGDRNSAFGDHSGENLKNGNNNTFVGAYSNVLSGSVTYSNSTAIGYSAIIDDSNQTYYIASKDDYSTLVRSIHNMSDKLDVIKYITMVAAILSIIMVFVDLYIQIKNSKNVLVEACIIDIEQPFINHGDNYNEVIEKKDVK